MYVCVYVHMYVCVYVHMHVYRCVCICVHVSLCAYAYMCVFMCVFDLPLFVESLFLIGQSKAICSSIHSKHIKMDNLYESTLAIGFNNENLAWQEI